MKEHNLYKAMQALEEESNMCLYRYSKELSFLRQMILDGLWDDVENFLEMTQIRDKMMTIGGVGDGQNHIAFVIGK